MRSRLYVSAMAAAAAFFAMHPSTLQAQEPSHKLTVMDEFQIQLPTDPQISPDGKKIVYVRRFADPMSDRRYSNLWIVNADGTDHRPLTTGNRNDASPRWSPDGARLAYLSDVDGKQQIYVRWMDSGQIARITNFEQSPDAIEWSPDGALLLCANAAGTRSRQRSAPRRSPHAARGRQVGRTGHNVRSHCVSLQRRRLSEARLHANFHRVRRRRRSAANHQRQFPQRRQ